jgi:predicted lactoylglutathione lyase
MAFFKALGFSHNLQFADDTAACIVISETILVMLLTHPTPAWDETLDKVSLTDAEQAQVYRHLIAWAGSVELLLLKRSLSTAGETTRPQPNRTDTAGRPPRP